MEIVLDGYPYDLGTYHKPVTTANDAAQRWFNRGLIWTYGFNHEEAIDCFRRAIAEDANCALAYWGLAYASGPNYNKPWGFFDETDFLATVKKADDAAVEARARKNFASPLEQALIEALQSRYPSDLSRKYTQDDFRSWNQSYADAMRNVYMQYPDDLDIATLFADALMNVAPWGLWDLKTGEPAPDAHTLEAKSVLDRALTCSVSDQHPGLLHMYIHLMEMSSTPEVALPKANLLRGLVPDAGHLHHMPTHLDILCGDYESAAKWNLRAIEADQKFLSRAGPVNFYTLYRSHDYHFRIYAAMFAGQSKVALESVGGLEASLPEALLRVDSPPMADWLEGFLSVRIHVLVRFGMWEQILALELPTNEQLFCVTTAFILYGRGIAFAATGQVEAAKEALKKFETALRKVSESRMLFNNRCIDILQVAKTMLNGEVEYRDRNFEKAFELLEEAVELDDSLPYDEPWGWMQPTRHALGALLLEQGKTEQAEKLFKADLGFDNTLPRALQHPNNVWSLHGYHECLVGLGKMDEARTIEIQLAKAIAKADVSIESSCFCRNGSKLEHNINSDLSISKWDLLTRELMAFVVRYSSQGVTASDEALRQQARMITYGSTTVLNETAADHPEWLDTFKRAYCLAALPGLRSAQTTYDPEDLDVHHDLGLTMPYLQCQRAKALHILFLHRGPMPKSGRRFSSLVVPINKALPFETIAGPWPDAGIIGETIIIRDQLFSSVVKAQMNWTLGMEQPYTRQITATEEDELC
ncbi:TPR domain protein, partial [Aureobasidium melanogenum]